MIRIQRFYFEEIKYSSDEYVESFQEATFIFIENNYNRILKDVKIYFKGDDSMLNQMLEFLNYYPQGRAIIRKMKIKKILEQQ